MKLLNKRISKGNGVLFMILTLLTVSSLLITTNINGKNALAKLSRGFYSSNIIKMYIAEINDIQLMLHAFDKISEDNIIVFKNNLEPGRDLRGIFYKGNVEQPPIKQGRFFTSQECLSNQKIALVGSEYEPDIIIKDGKKYIDIGNVEFEVIGYLGHSEASRFDTMQMIPIRAAHEVYGQDGQYVIDGNSVKSVSNAAEDLRHMLEPKAGYFFINESQSNKINRIEEMLYGANSTVDIIYAGIYLSFLLASISCMGFWISYRRQFIQVYRMNGFNNLQIIRSVLRKYGFVWLWATSAGFACVLVFRASGKTYPIYWIDFTFAAGCTLLPGTVLLLIYILRLLNKKAIMAGRM